MRLRFGAALLPALFLALTSHVRADLNDGKPCFTYINPPGNGLRFVCTSTSSQTVEHSEPVAASRGWRTRITARREGEPEIYDRTLESLSEPLGDLYLQVAFADAKRLVGGTGYAAGIPALLSSSTALVHDLPLAPSTTTKTVGTSSTSSAAGAQTICVGNLGDVAQPPPPLPVGSCGPGATSVTLRPLDASVQSPISDRLDDTNTHTRTDHYSALLLNDELTTAHYEIVARPALPCSKSPSTGLGPYVYSCSSTSHHDTPHDSIATFEGDAWSTQVMARLEDGAILYDVTVNSTVAPDVDEAVRQAFLQARRAIEGVAPPGAAVVGPTLASSTREHVRNALLPGAVRLTAFVSTFGATGFSFPSAYCVGDLGDLPRPPTALVPLPCPSGAWPLALSVYGGFAWHFTGADSLSLTHTHTQRDAYAGLTATGMLTTSHYEYVAETPTTSLTIPIVLSPSGGSAFTSELTLANFAAANTQVSFVYTPAFGGTSGTVTDTLPGATQRIVPDAVAYLKGLGLTEPGAGGTLRMTFEGSGSATPDVYAAVRTTAAVPEGRVGLAYPALPPSKLLSSSIVLCGLRQNSLDRSNVAVLNAGAAGDGDVTLRLSVASGDPANPQTKVLPDITLSPGGFSQISSILVSNGLALSNGYVRVERVSGTAPFYAYAVVNDQATADGSFIEPIAASPASQIASTTLPVVVETPVYSTELVLTNFSATNRTLNFIWVAPALTGGKATFSVNLLPNEQQILPGLVQLLGDRGAVTDTRGPSFAGALFVSDSTGDLRGIAISARILSALGEGRVGVALPSTPSGSESTAPVWLCGLQQNATTRSNLALVNTGSADSSSSSFRIDLYDGTNGAKVTSLDSTVPAKGFVQIDRILAVYAPGIAQGCALVTRTSGNNPFIAYAVLNDGAVPGQRSGDGAYVASVPTSP